MYDLVFFHIALYKLEYKVFKDRIVCVVQCSTRTKPSASTQTAIERLPAIERIAERQKLCIL